MSQKIKDFYKAISESGLRLPFAYDALTKKPSVSLLFMYIVFTMATVSNILLIRENIEIGTYTAIGFWVLATVFYMLRKLTTVKVDLDDREFEMTNQKDNKKETE